MALNIKFDETQFNCIFPFYILINPDLVVTSCGKTLEKLFPGTSQKFFLANYIIKRPELEIPDFWSMLSLTNQEVVIECSNPHRTILRGQFEFLESNQQLLFIGSPWFGSMEQVIANINLGLLEVDNDEIIQYANHSFCVMSGYSQEELIGRKASALLARPESMEIFCEKNELRKRGIPDAYELSVSNKKGEHRWWLISGAPNYNNKGELVGSVSVHFDITEKKKLELEMKNEDERTSHISAPEEQLYDLSLMNSFSRGSDAFIRKVVDLFCTQTPLLVDEMIQAYESDDLGQMGALAHKMKSSIASFKINSLTTVIQSIEKAGKEKLVLPDLKDLLDLTRSTIHQVVTQMRKDLREKMSDEQGD
jgi:PAS domain S-box-containing protein